LFRRYLADQSIGMEELFALLPLEDIESVLQREMQRIAEEEESNRETFREGMDTFAAWQTRPSDEPAFDGSYTSNNYAASEEYHEYNVAPVIDTLNHLALSRKRLEELMRADVIYTHRSFAKTCQAIAVDFQAINEELIAYFASHPDELNRLDWRKFEYLLDAIFRNQGYRTELGPGRGDSGVDIRLAQKDSVGEVITLVQAKRYAPEHPIKLEAVAALYGVVEDQQANRGLFVTTSRYLPSSVQFAAKHAHRLVLAAPEDIARWCRDITSHYNLKTGKR
jgi:hypothetical protein